MKTADALALAVLLAGAASAYYTNYYEDSFASIDSTSGWSRWRSTCFRSRRSWSWTKTAARRW